MSSVRLVNLSKFFNEKLVLDNINLDIKDGEMISLLGISGCGKSTMLQLIAGLISPNSGDILFNNKSVLDIPTAKREAVIVFQDYLLFPHMNVYENIEFGLKMKKVNKYIRKEKVKELIALVKLKGYENMYPNELSGGQKQRVAIARTLAVNPKVLLLDEPFSNLDINLRNEMREFILDLQKKLKITTILVTHDKEEALLMSDRIAVMVDGKIEQFDNPSKLYTTPVSKSVADIFGERNYIKGYIRGGIFKSEIININIDGYTDCKEVELMLPKEDIKIDKVSDNNEITGTIHRKRYAGDKTYYDIEIDNHIIKCTSALSQFDEGSKVAISINKDRIVLFFDV